MSSLALTIETSYGFFAQVQAQIDGDNELADAHGRSRIAEGILEHGFAFSALAVIVKPVDRSQMAGRLVFPA